MKIIEVRNVSKIYHVGDIDVPALRGVSLTVEEGEFVAIMGPSGSGKSTFMNILGCLDVPSAGEFLLRGTSVGTLSPDERAYLRNRELGFIFQSFNLLARANALENVELPLLYAGVPARERHQKAREVLRMVGLEGRERHLPRQLSGGQQQRVAIARALANRTAAILADEPTGNLDLHTGREIMDFFVELNRTSQITIVLVTHDQNIANYSHRIVRFLDGSIESDQRIEQPC